MIRVFLITLFLSASISASAAQAQVTLTLTPKLIDQVRGLPIGRLSVMRCRAGVLEPAPFQFDELDEMGFVWFENSGFDRDGKPGIYDGNDQLLLMYEDAGERCRKDMGPKAGTFAAEIEVQAPEVAPSYFYVVLDNSERSDVRYVEHDPIKGVTRTPYYFLTTDPSNELNWRYLGYLGYQGPPDASIINHLNMRMSGGVFMKFARMTLDNDNLRPKRTGFRIGPIRSIMHLETNVVFAGLPVMKLHVQALRYPNHYEAHSYAKVPTLYRKTLKEPEVTVSVSGNRLLGSKIWTATGGGLFATVDGKIDEQEEVLSETPLSTDDSWILFDSGKGFALLTELLVPHELEGIPLGLVYEDDDTKEQGDPLPNLGYALNGWPPADELNFSVRLLFFSSLEKQPVELVAALRSGKAFTVSSRTVTSRPAAQ